MKIIPSKTLSLLDMVTSIIGFITVIIAIFNNQLTDKQTTVFISLFSILALICGLMQFKSFLYCFLVGLFSALLTLRLGSLNGINMIILGYSVSFGIKILQFFSVIYSGVKQSLPEERKLNILRWHLIFIRMYIGLDLINHCVEKLFAGPLIRAEDVKVFTSLGLHNSLGFVILAGLCEFFGAIGVGLGAFTRIAAVGTALYLYISTVLGHHFSKGFIWAGIGGGYEYPLLWMVLILSFVFTGGQNFSIDGWLRSVLKKSKANNVFIMFLEFITR